MAKLYKYYFAQSKEGEHTDTLILDTETLYLGRLFFYKSHMEMTTALNNTTAVAFATVPGYNIALLFAGSLKGQKLEIKPTTVALIEETLRGMALFFLQYKITEKRKFYDAKYGSHRN